jgi:hypothetical protein
MSEGKVEVLTPDEYQAVAVRDMEETFHALAERPRPYPIPRGLSRKNVERAFHTAFEMVGGIPRLVLWADTNPTDFYKLYSRLLPQEVNANLQGAVQLVLPKTPLDE